MPDLRQRERIAKICQLIRQLQSQQEPDFDWEKCARPEQKIPLGDWRTWLILAGRGFGKTRTGAETVRHWVDSGIYRRLALVGNSYKEARDIMVDGESGLLNVYPPHRRPIFEPGRQRLVWSHGAVAYLVSAENPEGLRGPQFDAAWVDELAKFRNASALWDQLNLALRLGACPRVLVTTTPRPKEIIQQLIESPDVYVTRGSTWDNQANLAPGFLQMIQNRFQGTQLGMQEIQGELLRDTRSALWSFEKLDHARVAQPPELQRIVIGIDPATTCGQSSDETGIIVAGRGYDGRGYILEDLSGRLPPHEWARRAVAAYWHYKADRIIAETNAGGDLVERVMRSIDPQVSFKSVKATRGKAVRAEPIAALYEQGRISHVKGGLEALEQQMCQYNPSGSGKSPDRMDALVWALTELMLEGGAVSSPKAWLV